MSMWTAIALIAMASIVASAWRKKGSRDDSKRVQELNDRVDSLERDLGERDRNAGTYRYRQQGKPESGNSIIWTKRVSAYI